MATLTTKQLNMALYQIEMSKYLDNTMYQDAMAILSPHTTGDGLLIVGKKRYRVKDLTLAQAVELSRMIKTLESFQLFNN